MHQTLTTRHFADDTNLIHITNKDFPNKVRQLNIDLKWLNHWLIANKISLNSTKTEFIFFRKKGSPIPAKRIKLNGVKLIGCSEVKYVGIICYEHLTFESHRNILNSKLKRANNLLSISRHYVCSKINFTSNLLWTSILTFNIWLSNMGLEWQWQSKITNSTKKRRKI